MNIHVQPIRPESRWTESAVALLKKLHHDGFSASQIAGQLGVDFTRNAVIGKIHRLGLNVNIHLTAEEIAERFARRAQAAALRQTRRLRSPNLPKPRSQTLREMLGVPSTDCLEKNSKNIPFLELQPHHCRFAYGTGPYLFCGNDKTEGSSYCAGHHVLCWTPARVRAPTYVGRR